MMVLLNSFVFLLLLPARLPQPAELVSHGGAAEAHLEALGDAVQRVERRRELPLVLDPPHQLLHGGRRLPGVHRRAPPPPPRMASRAPATRRARRP
jgi:hypothetical protein